MNITAKKGKACGFWENNFLKGPSYPSLYEENNDCVYRVPIPQDTTVQISFEDFHLENEKNGYCIYDYLAITNDSNHVIGKYCGTKIGHSVVVAGSYVELTFHSDGSKNGRGFSLLFEALPISRIDCLDLLHKGYSENGIYSINPDGNSFFYAFCDQQTNGGGWMVIQRRFDGSVDFYRDWDSYKEGFGDFGSEFWLGNDNIHNMTTQGSQLLIELKDFDNQTAHASYGYFYIGTEAEKYVLNIGDFSGTAGDSMAIHNGMMFSTNDSDNDIDGGSCAQSFSGAWWYKACHTSNLNGGHGVNTFGRGINWQTWKGFYYSLKETAMKVKPRRERDWFYDLIFSGARADYVLLPRITDLKDMTSCWWIKTKARPGWSAVFSLHNYDNTSVFSFSINGNGSYLIHVYNEYRFFHVDGNYTDGMWRHLCITWFSKGGNWTFYTNGAKKANEGGLAANYSTGLGYLIIGGFDGSLTRFNMWDEYIDDSSRIKHIAHACSSLTGNVVPWPEVQLWRIGNVEKKNSSLCKFSELYRWNFKRDPNYKTRTYDGASGRRGTASLDEGWNYDKGVAKKQLWQYFDLGTYKSECLSNPNLCHQGLSLSFWLRYRPRFISQIQGYLDEHDNILGSWLDGVLPSHGKWSHCFRITHSNWRGNSFHHKCDRQGPTVVLIRVQQNIFGGFLDTQWGGIDGYIPGKTAFIFSLKNLQGLDPFKMELRSNKLHQAAKQNAMSGPIFGDGDIAIDNNAPNSVSSYTSLGNSYQLPPGLSLSSNEKMRLLAGSNNFRVDEMEVFQYRMPFNSLNVKRRDRFLDSQMNASSYLDESNATGRPEHAVLNNKEGSWCPFSWHQTEWLELDLGSNQTIYGVAVQGSHDSDSQVSKYTVSLRADSAPEGTWILETVSDGSADYFYPNQHLARFVRFTLKKWNKESCMRVGILKEFCSPGWTYFQGSCYYFSSTVKSWSDSQTHCLDESAYLVNIGSAMENNFIKSHASDKHWLGLKEVPDNRLNWIDDGTEPDYVKWKGGQPVYQDGRDECIYAQSGKWSAEDCGQSLQYVCEKILQTHSVIQWSASSWKCMTTPRLARLHLKTNCHSSWCGRVGDWLQLDLGRDWNVGTVLTQGARDDFGFVKSYKLSYKPSDGDWVDYKKPGQSNAMVFTGNWNGNTYVRQYLIPAVKANFIRFHPTECMASDRCCMRVEILETAYCPAGWEYFQGSCYLLTNYLRKWSDTMSFCRSKGADLIKISSAEENQFVQRSGKNFWLGLHRDASNTDVFKWNDGSVLTETSFRNWGSAEPNNHGNNEQCVHISDIGSGFVWNDRYCNELMNLSCEKEAIQVIFTTRGNGEQNPGVLFGYHEFSRAYLLSVSTSNQNWELRLPDSPLGWSHLGVTWSKQWGLRLYRDGVLLAEATKPVILPHVNFHDQFDNFFIGKDTTSAPSTWGDHFQMADLRIWESVIPEWKIKEVHTNADLPWYMWKNKGSPSFHWKLKHVCQGNQQIDSCDVDHYFRNDYEYKQIGCFMTTPQMQSLEKIDPILDGNFQTRQYSAVKCLNAARRKGNKIFALKNGGKCLSTSDSHVDVANRYEESSDCVSYKGSRNAMNIYIIKDNYNVAYKKPTNQSGTVKDSSLATDGSRMDSRYEMCSLTTQQKDPWWRVDLENQVLVREIYIYMYSTSKRKDYVIEIRIGNHDAPNLKKNDICDDSFPITTEHWRRIGCAVPLLGRYVSITRLVDHGTLMLCEVEVREETMDYAQASMTYPRSRGDSSILESQYVTGAVNCLKFSYNMSGEHVGRLNIYIVDQDDTASLVWRLAGNQGNDWKFAQVPIDVSQGFKIQIESVSDDGNIGETSIRDVRLGVNYSCACAPTQACRQLTGFHSAMISHIHSYQDTLMAWLSAAGFRDKYWVPCFRGAVDLWSHSTFHIKCDNKGPTLTLARKDSYLFGGFADQSWKNGNTPQKVPSSKAFLFSLKPFNELYGPKQFKVVPEKRTPAIRRSNKGPCWGYGTQELGFINQIVKINPNGVFDYTGIPNPELFFTGESDFQADDVEVFAISDSLCDPPCWEGETCDEISGKCVCDSNLREEEICRLKQELQAKRDMYCKGVGAGRFLARFDYAVTQPNNRNWRCYHDDVLTRDRRHYDVPKGSRNYYTKSEPMKQISNEDCRPLGMESEAISDSQITASSLINANAARSARLNLPQGNGRNGAWAVKPGNKDSNQWLQVDFVKRVKLEKVATQGRSNYDQWVTSYSLSYSMGGQEFQIYKHCGEVKIFDGNSDRDTVVSHVLNPVIFTRFIRILPKTWHFWISMRAEFYECHGYGVLDVDDLLSASKHFWTFDDLNSIKDMRGKTWAQVSGSVISVGGVQGQAIKVLGGAGSIRLTEDTKWYLALPFANPNVTLSLWLSYTSKAPNVAQTFLAAGNQETGDRGVHLYQEDGSREELTFKMIGGSSACSYTFNVPQKAWSHLVFTWNTSGARGVKVFRNGKSANIIAFHCVSPSPAQDPDNDIKLGLSQLPLASFDEIIIWKAQPTALQVEQLFRFYKGSPNLHVKVSMELTDEIFATELTKPGSEMFINRSSWLKTEVKNLVDEHLILKVENFQFWNVTHLAVSFTVRINGTGYKDVEPLETSLLSRNMLGSTPVKFVGMEANDVYVKPLQISAHNTSSTSLTVEWSELEELSHGIFCGVEIFYRLNVSSETFIEVTASGITEYELTNLQPYSWYVISVRPYTFEGEGKESAKVMARTAEDAPSSPPLNVNAFLNNSGALIVTWEPVPVEQHSGLIRGYNVTYTAPNTNQQQQIIVDSPSLSTELQNLLKGVLYSITVAAFNGAGQSPPSSPIVVRSEEGVPSLPPPIVVAHGTSFTSVMVSWQGIPEDHVHGVLKGYVVTLDGMDHEIYGCTLSETIPELKKSEVYKLQVAGFTSKGLGNFSDEIIVTTNINGCRALGMEDRNISDARITASSEFDSGHKAYNARLHFKGKSVPFSAGSWSAADFSDPWLQVDFGAKTTVVKVATQGRFDYDQWVKSYSLSYSHDNVHFEVYKQFGDVKIFQGNWDRHTVVYNAITPVISARYVRILPETWFGHLSMRTEFYTCEYDFKLDPVNTTSNIQNSTSIGLSWVPPDPHKLGEVISEYQVEVVDLLRGESINITVNSSSLELDFLKPFTSYQFKVFGSTSSWEGNITDTISLKTEEDAPSEPPRNLTIQHSTSSESTLQWKPVHEFSINGKLQGYEVKYKEMNKPTWNTIRFTVNSTRQLRRRRSVDDEAVRFNLEGLKAYTNYTVIVLAFTIKDGVPTLATNFTTAEDVPDHPATNITAYNTSSTSINVTWQPIPPDHVNGILLGYDVIYRRVDKVNDNISMVTVNSTSLNTELTGLGKYKLYFIQVAGQTVVGAGNFSDPVFVRTEQDVPDDPPGDVRAIGIESTVLKVYWLPVSNETINGIGLGYRLALFTIAGENIRNYNLTASDLSLEITGLDIWTNYSIKMVAFTIVGDGPWSDLIHEDTDEEVPYKPPANLTGMATNSTSIFVEWDPVDLPNIRGILRSYTVFYEETPRSLHPSVLRNISVHISVTEVQLVNLHKFTEYHIWVTAFTTRDGLASNLFIRTHEDSPDAPPLYITYSSPDSTTILLHWGPVPPQFKNGIVRGFKVEYQENQLNATVQVRERFLVNWALLDELKKFTEYSVRVRAFTSIGYGPENNITVLTSQDVPSKSPNSINAESHVTLTTIPVTWQPIDPHYIHGLLLGFKIRYQAVAVGEEPVEDQPIIEERVAASTLSFVLKNLEIFTLYRVDVLGYTIIGDGPPATDYAETCRCHKRLTTSWYEFEPYAQVPEDGILSGLIPPILSKLAVACCETCQSHGTSYVNFNSNGFNQSAELPDMRTLKSSIANPTDFFFPVFGHKDQTHFAKEFGYHGLVESPGMAYIIVNQDNMSNAVLNNIFSCWPAVMLFMIITYLSGLVVWAVESRCNPQDFPPSFTEGVPEGFYWAFVSMTTVGYGDRAPISILGRVVSVVVILTGLVLFGLVNGILATSITSVALETDYKIYGAKVAAIAETPEYRMGIRKNAKMDKDHAYHSFEDIYTALKEQKVIGALIDTYSAGSSKDMFAKYNIRVNKILDSTATYGIVMGKEARKLRICFKDYTQHAFANEISHHVQKNTEQLKEPPESLPVERSTGLFDSSSIVFQNTLLITGSLLISSLLLGIIYEIIRRLRTRAKVKPHDARKMLEVEMKEMVDNFMQSMITIKTTMAPKHEQERKNFLQSYMKDPRRKYEEHATTDVPTEELYFSPTPVETEADC